MKLGLMDIHVSEFHKRGITLELFVQFSQKNMSCTSSRSRVISNGIQLPSFRFPFAHALSLSGDVLFTKSTIYCHVTIFQKMDNSCD